MCVSKEVVFDQLKPGILWHIQTVHFPEKGGGYIVHCTSIMRQWRLKKKCHFPAIQTLHFSCSPTTRELIGCRIYLFFCFPIFMMKRFKSTIFIFFFIYFDIDSTLTIMMILLNCLILFSVEFLQFCFYNWE